MERTAKMQGATDKIRALKTYAEVKGYIETKRLSKREREVALNRMAKLFNEEKHISGR
jgi:hypothetical protein